jgi:hypothetical protein
VSNMTFMQRVYHQFVLEYDWYIHRSDSLFASDNFIFIF